MVLSAVIQRKSEGPVSTAWLKLPPPSLKHIETPPPLPLKKYKKINKLNLPIKNWITRDYIHVPIEADYNYR